MPDSRADTVVSRIASADDNHMPVLRFHIFFIFEIGIQQAFRVLTQKVNRKINSFRIPSRRFDIAGIGRAAGEYDAVELF